MKEHYDLEKMRGRKNPFVDRLTQQVTIRMGTDVIDYFKQMAEDTGLPSSISICATVPRKSARSR